MPKCVLAFHSSPNGRRISKRRGPGGNPGISGGRGLRAYESWRIRWVILQSKRNSLIGWRCHRRLPTGRARRDARFLHSDVSMSPRAADENCGMPRAEGRPVPARGGPNGPSPLPSFRMGLSPQQDSRLQRCEGVELFSQPRQGASEKELNSPRIEP